MSKRLQPIVKKLWEWTCNAIQFTRWQHPAVWRWSDVDVFCVQMRVSGGWVGASIYLMTSAATSFTLALIIVHLHYSCVTSQPRQQHKQDTPTALCEYLVKLLRILNTKSQIISENLFKLKTFHQVMSKYRRQRGTRPSSHYGCYETTQLVLKPT